MANLLDLAATGTAPKSILNEIAKREKTIETLESECAQLSNEPPQELDLRRIRKAVAEEASRLRELLADDVPVRLCESS